MKTCPKCGVEKPESEFGRHKGRKDGLRHICKACNAVAARAWYCANQDKATAAAKRWAEANPERREEITRQWREENRERDLANKRAYAAANRAKGNKIEAADG